MVSFPEHVSVTISPTTATVYDDSYIQFTATEDYDDGHSRTLLPHEILFDSSNPAIAVASSNRAMPGRVYGVSPGTCTITVSQLGHGVDPAYHDTATLTVSSPPPPPPPPSARFSLGFGADTHTPYPAWTVIDSHPNLVTSYSIDRGRSYELDQTDAGHATVTITDPDGRLDPTNPSGPYYGQIRPLLPAVLCRRDPVTGAWQQRFRGYVEDYTYDVDPSQRVNRLTLTLTDLFDVLAAAEMQPGQFGATTGTEDGQVRYAAGQRPDQRIGEILTDAGLPSALWTTLQGAVQLQTATYSAGEAALTAIQETADAEFPHVAGVYVDRHGRLVFHGRQARFDPAGAAATAGGAWDYHAWQVGDQAAVDATPGTVPVRALAFQRGLAKIINTATALEAGAPDDAVAGRQVTDTASVNLYGIRSWSQSNLLTLKGDLARTYPTSAATETKRFATFYVANYAHAHDRITQLAFRSLHPDDPRAAANWQLLTLLDIGDSVTVTVATPGGGGFTAQSYFVEGVHEEARPLAPDYDDVTLTLDLSPRSYYTVDPWATPLSEPDPLIDTDYGPNPPLRSSRKRKPPGHARDHEHDSPDPIRVHYENVGTGPGPGTGGLQFDTYPQDGGWLYLKTTDPSEATGSPDGWGIHLQTFNGFYLEGNTDSWLLTHSGTLKLESELVTELADPFAAVEIKAFDGMVGITGKIVWIQNATATGRVILYEDGTVELQGAVSHTGDTTFTTSTFTGTALFNHLAQFHDAAFFGNTVDFDDVVAFTDTSKVGFYGKDPIAQPAHPTTLTDVIAALANLGLVA